MRKLYSGTIGTMLLVVITASAVYFGNIELQSYWGRQAVSRAGLRSYSLQKAVTKAGLEKKRVLVDVSAIWCGNCRRLDDEVFANAKVKELINEGYVFSRLEYDSEEGQRFVNERNVRGFPNLWILDGDGKNVKRLMVTFDPEKFAAQLR